MKHLIFSILMILLFACSNGKEVYWCGDHACINNKEKEAYFKKTMIVEIKELGKQDKKSKSELEIIKKQAGLEQKEKIKNDKELAKQVRLDEKRSSKKKVPKKENKKIIINTSAVSDDISSSEFKFSGFLQFNLFFLQNSSIGEILIL